MKTDAIAFWTVFMIIFFINIVTPYIAAGLNQATITTHDSNDANVDTPPSVFAISGFAILTVPFWTLGMPSLMNIFLMIPMRALAWYLLIRMIRGN